MKVLAVAFAAFFLMVPVAFASDLHPSQSEMETQLVCPACHLPLDESSSPVAQQMKAYIRKRIAEGATATQIKDELVAQLGTAVLGVPGTHGFDLLAWLMPMAGIGVGAVLIGFGAWTWTQRTKSDAAADDADTSDSGLDAEQERRVDEELARFDA